MKQIEKRDEPKELAQWKIKRKVREDWQPEWKRLKKKVRDAVMVSLLEEQGEICCYCCRDVSFSDRHIEHFRPQKKNSKPKDLIIRTCLSHARRTKIRVSRGIADMPRGTGLRKKC